MYLDGSGVKKVSNGDPANVPIGTGANDLHIGDLVFLDYGPDGAYDHTTVLYSDQNGDSILDGYDKVVQAHQDNGVTPSTLKAKVSQKEYRFVLRVGW